MYRRPILVAKLVDYFRKGLRQNRDNERMASIWAEIRPPNPAGRSTPPTKRRGARALRRLLLCTPSLAAISAAIAGLVIVANQQSAKGPEPIMRADPAPTVIRPVLVDLNTATVAELATLPGIGTSRAETIVDLRVQQPFRSLADLADRGILRPAEILALAGLATVYVDLD